MIRWDLVIPMIALGFRLKASMRRALHLWGRAEYRVRPVSLVTLMNTLPVLLWRVINSDAVSSCLMLCILLRQDVVRGMDHSFFLVAARSFYIQRVGFFRPETFSIGQHLSTPERFSDT